MVIKKTVLLHFLWKVLIVFFQKLCEKFLMGVGNYIRQMHENIDVKPQ
jgi:hypothetical protein